jgi:phosphoribosyl 1,2-cyclic phosphate phosphodiesterase
MRNFTCTVLGSGTSAGVPSIGCDCDVCTSDDPRDTRLRTAAALQWIDADDHPRVLLIDAGPDLRQQVLAAGIDRCDGILITHNHVDHVFGLDEVRRFNVTMRESVTVWAEPHVQQDLRRVYQHIFASEDNVNPSFVAKIELCDLEPNGVFELYGLRITPIRMLHGSLPILGFRFDAVDASSSVSPLPMAWCTDVSEMSATAVEQLGGLDTLFLDMLRERSHKTHLNLAEATALATRLEARHTWFVHMGHEVSHAGLSEQLQEGMALAFDGLKLGG